ncbi:hypothetical protein H6F73_13555 [Microcoleus sp. FACHB-68]|nr:hypothetical protein [Microcoleus sp. FACHB-68]
MGIGHGALGMGQGCANLKVGALGIGHWGLGTETLTTLRLSHSRLRTQDSGLRTLLT